MLTYNKEAESNMLRPSFLPSYLLTALPSFLLSQILMYIILEDSEVLKTNFQKITKEGEEKDI